mgnify:CR=1 FL=1
MKNPKQRYLYPIVLGFGCIPLSSIAEMQPQRIPLEDVQRFSTAISQIKNYYVKPVKNTELFDNAIKGMLTGLDPHSAYLDEEAFKELQTSTNGEFGGLGIEVTMDKGVIKVISPIDDTPASKADIQAGDYIIKLGDKAVQGLTLKEAVDIMRGKIGTKISMIIIRKGEKKPLKKILVRESITIKSVKSNLIDNNYGYVRLSHFQTKTAKNMIQSIAKLKKDAGGNIKGLILDLRNNPGGLLDSAIEASDAFINNDKKGKEELIVYTEGRLENSKFIAKATPGDILNNAPIIVLINGGSASGSEIVAGALKDHKRALLMGTKSFGKGSVQTVLPLDAKTAIKFTTALYYTPSGISIQAKGITPDIIIKNTKVPKRDPDDSVYDNMILNEADLSGHLKNGNKKSSIDKAKKKQQGLSSADILYKDYQLHQAINVLKGMTLSQR